METITMEQQLQERLSANISAFDALVKQAEAFKVQSDALRKLVGPMTSLVNNDLAGDEALSVLTQLAEISADLPETVIGHVVATRELLTRMGATGPDRTSGDQAAKTLADTIGAFKALGVDLPETEQITKLVEAWNASRPVAVSTGTRARNAKGPNTEITSHCMHAGCTWNNIDRTNKNSARWNAIGHYQTHHAGQDKPAKDSGSQQAREVWLSMTEAIDKILAGGNGQTSADALKAEMRFDIGNTTS